MRAFFLQECLTWRGFVFMRFISFLDLHQLSMGSGFVLFCDFTVDLTFEVIALILINQGSLIAGIISVIAQGFVKMSL